MWATQPSASSTALCYGGAIGRMMLGHRRHWYNLPQSSQNLTMLRAFRSSQAEMLHVHVLTYPVFFVMVFVSFVMVVEHAKGTLFLRTQANYIIVR
mmetsp:Transcript_19747/g.38232  ORF Transcript_19747/g.38232 Transcript_19747/m.38232 type:complete len:96 (-) Transcript_19747:399-686(-)